MGDSASCDFDVAEILGYQTRLSPSDEALVGGYLAAKYGISTAYPAYKGPTSAIALKKPPAVGNKTGSKAATLSVKKDLVCWYDAAVGVTTDGNGALKSWNDLSGNLHHGTPGRGAAVLALNQINSRPAVQFRRNWLALAGTFFAKEQYICCAFSERQVERRR